MQSNTLERTVDDILRQVLETADDGLFVVNPTCETIEELIEELEDGDPTVRLLADERALKDVMDDFLLGSQAADHVDAGRLTLRIYEGDANTLFVTDSSVVSLVDAGDAVAGLTTDDESFIDSICEKIENDWEAAEPFQLRTPSISRVRSSLADELGETTASDFDAVLSSLSTARGNGEGLDEVTVSLLVAAKNEDLLYDVSKWGEDVGIASKATFSRTKTRLEETGLIDTEKVPIDVGRPRLRLCLGDDRLKSADTGQLASVAQSMLAAT